MRKITKEEDINRIQSQSRNWEWVVFRHRGSYDNTFAIKLDALNLTKGYSLDVRAEYLDWEIWAQLFYRPINTSYNAVQIIRKIQRGLFVEVERSQSLLDINITTHKQSKPSSTIESSSYSSFISF
ncbi:hypothetical protein [Aeromonas veronii]|uniref:hypothetical protein n=1 Tax=Aeromonas veronii TaxID=654 RepID=UPI00191D1F42|nr:hypothetical protein [Aeromonas veronii]MBL0506245.1 hypothetical protein [Aeromonas veronii]HDX8349220.1 hypothetical protein [Aeromonas veronii]